ncbi:MAG: peptidoglycan bridge formation glycyltransferase FemA/FemB family protein, partial [Spirochaetes bacterium]|nr:peptidoglycan bridge formation glycyltransferase FemA/FemB family protein [Spirochaetota bacterium]
EKNNITIEIGDDDHLFESFIKIYHQLLNRKKFKEPNDINEFRQIQKDLPNEYKMRILLAYNYQGNIAAGSIFTALGNTGIYLFGAINQAGMESKASYLLQWKIIEELKNSNTKYFDLHGINPVINPGTYHFKSGLCGKNGRDITFLGQYEAYPNIFMQLLVNFGELIRRINK